MFQKEIKILQDNLDFLSTLSKENWIQDELSYICTVSDQICKVIDSIIKLTINSVD